MYKWINQHYSLITFKLLGFHFELTIRSNERIDYIKKLGRLIDDRKNREAVELYEALELAGDLDPELIRLSTLNSFLNGE